MTIVVIPVLRPGASYAFLWRQQNSQRSQTTVSPVALLNALSTRLSMAGFPFPFSYTNSGPNLVAISLTALAWSSCCSRSISPTIHWAIISGVTSSVMFFLECHWSAAVSLAHVAA